MNDFTSLVDFFKAGYDQAATTAQLFLNSIASQLSLIGIIDIIAIALLLGWLVRKLRRSDLIKVLPRLIFLLIAILIARLLGLWGLFYFGGALLVISLLSLATLYAPEVKGLLEVQFKRRAHTHKAQPISTADIQSMIKSVSEAMAVLLRSQKPVLIVIKKGKNVNRLIDNGNKMNTQLTPDLLIDLFDSGSALSKGAVVIDGNQIVASGSTLFKPNAKVLFSTTNPSVMRAAKDLKAVVIVSNKTIGDINLLDGENTYKNLSPQDLRKLLQNIFIYNKEV